MNSNIPATLDLAKSLQTFEEAMTTALALDDASQWDGRTIKDRVGKIRQAALILAGQCIASAAIQSLAVECGTSDGSKADLGMATPV